MQAAGSTCLPTRSGRGRRLTTADPALATVIRAVLGEWRAAQVTVEEVATVTMMTKVAIPDGTIEARADTVEEADVQVGRAEEVGGGVVGIRTNPHRDRVRRTETQRRPGATASARRQMQGLTTWRSRQLMRID